MATKEKKAADKKDKEHDEKKDKEKDASRPSSPPSNGGKNGKKKLDKPSGRGVVMSGMSPAAVDLVWTQRLKKEQKQYYIGLHRQMESMAAPRDVALVAPLKSNTRPQERYDYPMTEAQEAGWNCQPLAFRPLNTRTRYSHEKSDVVAHADALFLTLHVNPFQRNKGLR